MTARPRLGFAGVGWIGRRRLAAILADGSASIVAITDPSAECRASARAMAPDALEVDSVDSLLALDLDGIVISTPSGLHAAQVRAALARGLPVFCQKPLAASGEDAAAVVDAARRADLLLHVDMSYRHVEAVLALRELLASGALGHVFGIDLVFHNAYGPNQAWCQDRRLAGGGCLIDLGVHLVDLALWLFDFPAVSDVRSRLYASGQPNPAGSDTPEDFAVAQFGLSTGATVRLACSWRLSFGAEAAIDVVLYGTRGSAAVHNVNGSFVDFRAEHYTGATRAVLTEGPDEWGGRAAVAWVRELTRRRAFDPVAERYVDVARLLDRIYAAAGETTRREGAACAS